MMQVKDNYERRKIFVVNLLLPLLSVTLSLHCPDKADQPEEAVVGADRSRPEGQIQPTGSPTGRIARRRV